MFVKKGQCNVRNFTLFFFRMISDVPAFKVRVFCKRLWILNFSKLILVVDIPTQSLLTILISIDHSSRCKLKVYIVIHTKDKPYTTNLYFSQNWQGNDNQKSEQNLS